MNIYFSFKCLVLSKQHYKTRRKLDLQSFKTGENSRSSYSKSWNWRIFYYIYFKFLMSDFLLITWTLHVKISQWTRGEKSKQTKTLLMILILFRWTQTVVVQRRPGCRSSCVVSCFDRPSCKRPQVQSRRQLLVLPRCRAATTDRDHLLIN